jgi:hypothetical protein
METPLDVTDLGALALGGCKNDNLNMHIALHSQKLVAIDNHLISA